MLVVYLPASLPYQLYNLRVLVVLFEVVIFFLIRRIARLIAFPRYLAPPIRSIDVLATGLAESLPVPNCTIFNLRNLHIATVPVDVYGLPLGIFVVPYKFFVILIACSPVDVAPWVSMYLIAP